MSIPVTGLTRLTGGHLKRLQKEYRDICAKLEEGIVSLGPREDNEMSLWDAWIQGPENSPYEGGIFHLEISLPQTYPFKPPMIIFITKILHCNIDRGRISLDILRDGWSPALTIQKVLLSVRDLMANHNPNDPVSLELGILLRDNPAEYYQRVREATLQFATLPPAPD